MNFDNLISICKIKRVRGLPRFSKPNNVMCKQCQWGNMKKSSFKSKTQTYDDILELVHIDLCGPIGVKSYYGDKYFILCVDDYSRMTIVIYLKQKSNVF